MSLWIFGIFVASVFLVLELRKIRMELEELNGYLRSMELNFIKNIMKEDRNPKILKNQKRNNGI